MYRNIKSCCRFIRYKKSRFTGERHCYHYSLEHSSTHFKWILFIPLFSRKYSYFFKQSKHIFLCLCLFHFQLFAHKLSDLLACFHYWVKRCHRVLKYHCNIFSLNSLHLLLRQRKHINFFALAVLEKDLSRISRMLFIIEPHNRFSGNALSAAAFTHNAMDLALLYAKVYSLNSVNYTSDRHKIYRQIFYFNYIMLVHKNTYLLFILLPFDGAGYG